MQPAEFPAPATAPVRYIMIGGFLGSGKTTAVARLAQRLSARGIRVGIITNDQGRELVDTGLLRAKGFAAEEIPGGCFCCRFSSLLDAADKLTQAMSPEVFIAEPVGSCTDLVATVTYPLRRLYGRRFTIAPVSVLVDPIRAMRIFGLEKGGNFSERVLYIYRKQLEEADLIVISKCDLMDEERLNALRAKLSASYTGKDIYTVSARSGTGLDEWFENLTRRAQDSSSTMELDYRRYAQGESLLGWLNGTVRLNSEQPFDGDALLQELASDLQHRLRRMGAEIAHLKATLNPDAGLGELGAVSLVRNDFVPELSMTLQDPVSGGELILNLRAEAPSEALAKAAAESLGSLPQRFPTLSATVEHLEHFQPAEPVPTHRLTSMPP